MKVAIIGAGPSGLSAIKHCIDEDVECVAFEQSGQIGGIWNYYGDTKVDEYGLEINSCMYDAVITNLPKELTELEGLHYKENEHSFISRAEVLEYVQQYTDHFNLLPYVKLHHKVEFVDPQLDKKWTVQVRDLKTKETITDTFDGVLVCNGHYYDPFYPTIPGMEHFEDRSMHSQSYRNPDKYRGKRVLIVGGGPSGVDIANLVSQVAEKVFFSFRKEKVFGRTSDDKSILKPGISRLEPNRVVFLDGTEEEIDQIIYCTGFNCVFPFLSENCQIQVEENWVKPLYKHLINIEHPSMAIILIITHICTFPLAGLQVRFYLALLKGQFHVSKEEMYEDLRKDREHRDERGFSKKWAHAIGPYQKEYCEDLARIAGIRGLPPVIGTLFKYLIAEDMPRDNYRIINDEEYEIIHV